MKRKLSKEELIELLKKRIEKAGGQKAFADSHGVSKQYLNDVVRRKKNPAAMIQKALGVKEIILYEVENNS